jgi:hypothetical protein
MENIYLQAFWLLMTREMRWQKFNLIKLIEFREINSVIAVFALHIVALVFLRL